MILIVGCGFLGQYLLKEIQTHSGEPIVVTYRKNKNDTVFSAKNIRWVSFDAVSETDRTKLKHLCENEALTVFYLASCHNIDLVYSDPASAYQINVAALRSFLQEFSNIKTLIYASTDCVYGEGAGNNRRFLETDETRPVNTYGSQKKEAEQLILQAGFHVARLPYMLGPSLSAYKTFYDRIADDLDHQRPVFMADGLERSVLSYRQAANLLARLAFSKEIPPVVNIADDRGYTKYEMGLHIAQYLGCSETYIQKMPEPSSKKLFADRRAASTVMDNRLLKKILKIDRLEWECP